MEVCQSGHKKVAVLTGGRIKRVNYTENVWAFFFQQMKIVKKVQKGLIYIR